MPSENKRSGRSHPRTAPPILPAIAPSTASSMPPTNPEPSHVYPAHPPNTRMPSHSEPFHESRLDLRLNPLLGSASIQTGLETLTEDAHSRRVHDIPGQVVRGQSFDINAPVSAAHGIGRDTVPLSGHIGTPGEKSARNGFPYIQDNDVDQADRPRKFQWVSENPAETPKGSHKKRDALMQRLTIDAGGSCIFCSKSKKGCDAEMPCNRCKQKNLPCVRGGYSSLCMAFTVKHDDHYELHPAIFAQAQDALQNLKQNLRPSSFPVVVHWVFDNQRYRETLISAADQLDLRQAETTLGKPLMDLLVSPQSDLSDDLSRDAQRASRLLAAIKGLSMSDCLTDPVNIRNARVIVFFLMTIYTIELYEVSLRLAKGLYDSLKTISSTRKSERPVLLYMKVIDDMVNLQWPNSLMSAIFAQAQPRLQGLQDLLRLLFFDENFKPTSHANHTFDFGPPEFEILIGVRSQIQGICGSVDFAQIRYIVSDLLCSEFGENMAQTIDPSLLPLDMTRNDTDADHDDSTTLCSSDDQAIFSNQVGSGITNTTYPPPDVPDLTISRRESTVDLGVEPSAGEDFAFIGDHLN